ncbi:glycoside hydrolase family 31 protein [Cytophagales bacterium LB-30]|uniref:Glycoside hydrolase family 31 protein n=1 Tax=Shiella aurantiaca TaxID=3058365 RepID=A0ABT8F1I0_9BACT|nr:glycoside hydrolase family 31 protein [Shiella aurantiaca]MDN4164094.1 glycoside hydrolase family 31 protein [Shiella aurantiaca]
MSKIYRFYAAILVTFALGIHTMAAQSLNQSLGNLSGFNQTEFGLKGSTPTGTFEVSLYSPSVIRVRIVKNNQHDDFSYSVIAQPKAVKFNLNDGSNKLTLSTDSVQLEITKNPVRFTLLTKDGKIVNQDDAAFGTSWIGDEVTTYKKLQPDEKFIGLGEKTGNLNRRGEGYTNYNTDYFGYPANADMLYVSTPFYIGLHSGLAYGIYMDNTYKSHFNFGASNNRFSSFTAEEGPMDYYLIHHKSVAEIIKSYTDLTGRMNMPPLWSLGYQQCRYSYYPDTEVLTVAKTFRDKKIPSDVIYLDIHYMDEYKIFTWNGQRFPNPDKMLEELKAMGFHVVIIVDPGIKVEEGYEAYEEGLKKDAFVKYPDGTNYTGQVWPGWCYFPDFTNPVARQWWGQSFKGYVDNGIDGFWNDMNEIATWGQRLPELMTFNYEGHPSTTRRARNMYGMQMARSTYEGTRSLLGGKRPFILTRAGFSGVQRYSAVWTGDNLPTDEHMMLGVRLVNSLGLTGIPYTGPDVGGFGGNTSVDLFARWISIGAFTPFFRGHKAINNADAEPWAYGEEVEEISRNYIQLRYNLMPYIYSNFYEASQSGVPVARSLAIYHPFDDRIYQGAYQHQYMFGPNIMVAPVESNKQITKVLLPSGSGWYDLHTGKYFAGNQEIYADCPKNQLPLYIKAGAIIPMQSPVLSAAEKNDGELKIHVYKGEGNSVFTLYEDDGETYEFEQGNFSTRDIRYDAKTKSITLAKPEGKFASKYSKVKLVLVGFEDLSKTAKVGGKKATVAKDNLSYLKAISKFDPIGAAGKVEGIPTQTISFDNSSSEIKVQW